MSKMTARLFGFFLALLWLWAPALCAGEAVREVAVPTEAAEEGATPGVDSAVMVAQQEVRDPFESLSEPETLASTPTAQGPAGSAIQANLQGIGFGSKDAYAVIGGEVYYIGDEKNGIKLLEVRRREVDIFMNEGRATVSLFPGDDLQKAKDRAKKKSAVKSDSEDSLSARQSSLSGREQTPL